MGPEQGRDVRRASLALAVLSLIWVFSALNGTPPIRWTWTFAGAIGFSAVLGSAFSWMLFYYALARLPASIAGLGTLATPVIGVVTAWVHFGERLMARVPARMSALLNSGPQASRVLRCNNPSGSQWQAVIAARGNFLNRISGLRVGGCNAGGLVAKITGFSRNHTRIVQWLTAA
jgi:hypothetical protein